MIETSMINEGRPFLYSEHAALGMTKTGMRQAVADGSIVQLIDRVYADAGVDDTRELRIEAASLAVPAHAVLCDETAAWVWGLDAHRPSDRHRFAPKWVVPHGASRARLDGVICRQALLDDSDIVEVNGLRVTTPLRTTADLLRKQWRPYALASADAMARVGLVRPMDVRAYLAELKGYRGIRQARVLARYIEPKAATPGESWTRLRLVDGGFPVPRAQVEVIDAAGGLRYLDLAYVKRRVAIEFDGREFHTSDADLQDDEDRHELVVALGYRIVRVRYEGLFGKDNAFEREVGEVLGMTPIARWW